MDKIGNRITKKSTIDSVVVAQPVSKYTTFRHGINSFGVLKTDKKSYKQTDILVVSGQIKNLNKSQPLSLIILDENGRILHIAQLSISQNKSFSDTILLESLMVKSNQTCLIRATYGSTVETTTFRIE